jgi:hypothetical protein
MLIAKNLHFNVSEKIKVQKKQTLELEKEKNLGFWTNFSTSISSLLNDFKASLLAEYNCCMNSSGVNAIRMPLPPPLEQKMTFSKLQTRTKMDLGKLGLIYLVEI